MAKKGIDAININLDGQTRKILDQIGSECAQKIKQESPRKTGKYAAGWVHRFITKDSVVVYNVTKPKLVHLLEKGHVAKKTFKGKKKTIGFSKPVPHVKPVAAAMGKKYFKELENIKLKSN